MWKGGNARPNGAGRADDKYVNDEYLLYELVNAF